MPDELHLRMYAEYEILYVSEFCRSLSDVERAYNGVDAFLGNSRRVRRANRLRVSTIHTGQSILVTLSGHPLTIVAVGILIERTILARKHYWEGTKAKWEGLSKRAEYQESHIEKTIDDGIQSEHPLIVKAIKSLRSVFDRFDKSMELTQLRITEASDQPLPPEETDSDSSV